MAEEEEEPTIKKARIMKSPSLKLVEKEEEKMKMRSATCKVKFVARQNPLKHWDSWVEKLCSVHQSTWKDAGIYEAIMGSSYAIKRHDDLILELASRWCTRTNTFVFEWGEATLTLEDMLVLGGFSALGLSVLRTLENDAKSLKIVEQLELARKELVRTRAQSALQGKWLQKFKECGSDLEHAAFLSLWLSRFGFPTCKGIINKHVFPVAAWLSRGIKIALGPAVLAMLYRDLAALTKRLCFTQLVAQSDNTEQLVLCAPFHLVQVWAWERFPMLKPVPNFMYSGENFPRSARWSNLKISEDKDLRSAIDSSENTFLWCPYGEFSKCEGRDPESIGQCIKTIELIGLDSCVERYQPQRVARQFGLDEDILSDNADKATGRNTLDDMKLCPISPIMNARDENLQKQQKYSTSSQVKVEKAVDSPPPRFSAQIEVINVGDSDCDSNDECSLKMTEITKLHVPETRPRTIPSLDVAMEDTCSMDKTKESERAEKQQTFPLTSAQRKMGDDQDFVLCGIASHKEDEFMEEEKMKMSSETCKVKFVGWSNPTKLWDSWVKKLCSIHQSTWKEAGIYEAIMCSTYGIKRHDDLILELASRWCTRTSTFVFPWGQATLTLEDMLVLGGFSALGLSVLRTLENDAKSLKIVEQLELARKELVRTRAQSALQGKWLQKFKECGSDLEHAAFLSLWLSRFVFPLSAKGIIDKHIFPVAARLSNGIKIALGPAVLAMLYRDLSTLTRKLHSSQLVHQSGDNVGQVDICALFNLVQLWAWERFPMLKPVPNCAYSGENFPRLARWSNVKILKDRDLRSAIDSSGKAFLWCPYGSSIKYKGTDLDSFGRCIKTCELRGFDSCIVRYQPQLVARQFGLDEGIPSDNVDKVTGRNTSDDVKLCPTSPTVDPSDEKQRKYSKSSQVEVEKALDSPPPGFPARIEVINVVESESDSDDDCSLKMTEHTQLHVPETGSGRPYPFTIASPDVSDEDDDKNENGQVQLQHTTLLSPPSNHVSNEAMDFVNEAIQERRTGDLQNELDMSCDAESYTNEISKDFDFDLEARINRLENIVYAYIKALEARKYH